MTVTQRQVDEACGNIQRSLEAFAADPDKLDMLHRALAARQWLREQYRAAPAALEPHLDRLRELGAAVTDCIRSARQMLTEEYLRATEAAGAWRQRRQACRDALVELALADGLERFDSPLGQIEVRQGPSVTMPKPGTAQRAELEALLHESGRWDVVSAPYAGKLLKALEGGLFSPDQAARLSELCQIHTACRLAGRRRSPGR